MGCVPCVSNIWAFGTLKIRLERDTCHPPDWATCLLPAFHHVATDRAVWKTGHPRRERCVRLHWVETPEGKAGVYIDHRFQRTRVEGSSTSGESTPGENAGGKFETSEARSTEMIHSR
jgi:hypothetical protein